jgi:hypothetical protein
VQLAFAVIGGCSSSLRDSLHTLGRIGLPFCNTTRSLTLSIDPDMAVVGPEEPTAAPNAAGFSAMSTGAGFLSMTQSKVRAAIDLVSHKPGSLDTFGFSLDAIKHWEGGWRTPEVPDHFYINVLGPMRL